MEAVKDGVPAFRSTSAVPFHILAVINSALLPAVGNLGQECVKKKRAATFTLAISNRKKPQARLGVEERAS